VKVFRHGVARRGYMKTSKSAKIDDQIDVERMWERLVKGFDEFGNLSLIFSWIPLGVGIFFI
jgi:hypothetical protein